MSKKNLKNLQFSPKNWQVDYQKSPAAVPLFIETTLDNIPLLSGL